MGSAPRIQLVDHRELAIARQLHAVQMSAYAQEAKLLGAVYFPPLERTVEDVRYTDEVFLAGFIGDSLVGCVSVGPDPEGMGTNIASLVVAPQFQRQGIGTALMASVFAAYGSSKPLWRFLLNVGRGCIAALVALTLVLAWRFWSIPSAVPSA